MDGKSFIELLVLKNLLSYSDVGATIELRPLNVLIGPNGAGKSNLIQALSLLQAAPDDLTDPIRGGGGIDEWLWKGAGRPPIAVLQAVVAYPDSEWSLCYDLAFTEEGHRFSLVRESIEPWVSSNHPAAGSFYYRFADRTPLLAEHDPSRPPKISARPGEPRRIRSDVFKLDRSILAQRRDPDRYPEVTYLADQFGKMQFYRDWNLGHRTAARRPQSADEYSAFLSKDAGNLSLVLNELDQRSSTAARLLELLRKFYEPAARITTSVRGGTVQLDLHEQGLDRPIPATRLSDGTLRFLSLLAILLHPDPPPLICLEEPELGLHPDILPTVAELLLDAAQRTQLIVTTHSEVLVSALSRVPEAVIICERDERGTQLRRLDAEQLQEWLEEYSLGQLWRMGQLGGNRW